MTFTKIDILDRAAAKFQVGDSGCWDWTAGKDADGYGLLWDGAASRGAYRVIYEEVVRQVPAGLELDHLCKNKGCVNPDHLEEVTPGENTRRARARDFCKYGHPFTPENRYYSGNKSCCRPCNLDYQRRKRAVA